MAKDFWQPQYAEVDDLFVALHFAKMDLPTNSLTAQRP